MFGQVVWGGVMVRGLGGVQGSACTAEGHSQCVVFRGVWVNASCFPPCLKWSPCASSDRSCPVFTAPPASPGKPRGETTHPAWCSSSGQLKTSLSFHFPSALPIQRDFKGAFTWRGREQRGALGPAAPFRPLRSAAGLQPTSLVRLWFVGFGPSVVWLSLPPPC